jgi:hypothetical protein
MNRNNDMKHVYPAFMPDAVRALVSGRVVGCTGSLIANDFEDRLRAAGIRYRRDRVWAGPGVTQWHIFFRIE